MPNHYLTVGLCAKDYKRLEEQGKEDFDAEHFKGLEGSNLCEIVLPLPDELSGIVATNPPCRYLNKVTGEWSKSCNGEHGEDAADWKRVDLSSDDIAKLVFKYGASNWFDWQTENWGTKWGTYDLKVHELGGDGAPILIEFESAWGPPNAEMMRKIDTYLCEKYCLKNIKWSGHNPYNNGTEDIEIADLQVSP